MNDETLSEPVREAAAGYNVPPPTPREEIWGRIQAERRRDELTRRRRSRLGRVWWGAGIAAALVVGIGLGRMAPREEPAGLPPVAASVPAAPAGLPYRVAAAQHLGQAEVLLTSVQTQSAGALDAETVGWARDLLSTTRLLLDSPAVEEPRLRALLEDLELVLMQIAQLPEGGAGGAAREELDLIRDAIHDGGVMPRLRTQVPAGTPAAAL